MLSKAKIKYIHSLDIRKYRKEEQRFVAEGRKTVDELIISGYVPTLVIYTDEWISPITLDNVEKIYVTQDELKRASLLQTPQQVIGVFKMKNEENTATLLQYPQKELCLLLDSVQDPGNLGTIIRTADWFGINHIFCNKSTVDAYNPKVIQATMGSIAHVNIHYIDTISFVKSLNNDVKIYGTQLDGKNIYSTNLEDKGIIVMGNEGKGISEEMSKLLTDSILIPSHSCNTRTAESLNVSIATAIVCAEFRRRSVK